MHVFLAWTDAHAALISHVPIVYKQHSARVIANQIQGWKFNFVLELISKKRILITLLKTSILG
jgi:hypothetical protein